MYNRDSRWQYDMQHTPYGNLLLHGKYANTFATPVYIRRPQTSELVITVVLAKSTLRGKLGQLYVRIAVLLPSNREH